jgi:hypothetical protein
MKLQASELQNILENHKLWVYDRKKGKRAIMIGANLSGADLSEADLSGADLSEADLSGADLRGADLPIFCKWEYSIVENKIKIGCKIKTIEEWEEWLNSDEEYMTKRNENDFKRIEATIRACITYCKYLNN